MKPDALRDVCTRVAAHPAMATQDCCSRSLGPAGAVWKPGLHLQKPWPEGRGPKRVLRFSTESCKGKLTKAAVY